MTVVESDLFVAIENRQFDLITFNPPFYDRAPRDMADRAWATGAGSDTVWRFCDEAHRHLRPGGTLLIMGSTDAPYTAGLRHVPGYHTRLAASWELVSERLFLFSLQHDRPVRAI
jgi:methylase of polypeptide subunit release factors